MASLFLLTRFSRQHITKKHGHCPECDMEFKEKSPGEGKETTIASVETWAAKQGDHKCEHGKLANTARKTMPEALEGTARGIWRNVGGMTGQRYRQSVDWDKAKRRVEVVRKIRESEEERQWVVWYAILFPEKDNIDGVNPRKSTAPLQARCRERGRGKVRLTARGRQGAEYWAAAYAVVGDDWCVHPAAKTGSLDFPESLFAEGEHLDHGGFMQEPVIDRHRGEWKPAERASWAAAGDDDHKAGLVNVGHNMTYFQADDSGYGTHDLSGMVASPGDILPTHGDPSDMEGSSPMSD